MPRYNKKKTFSTVETIGFETTKILRHSGHKLLKRYPTSCIDNSVFLMINNSSILGTVKNSAFCPHSSQTIDVSQTNGQCNQFTNVKLSKYLANFLKPLAGYSHTFILNSLHFAKKIKDFKLDTKDLLVSFAIISKM